MGEPTESAVLVLVPAAEPVIGEYRSRFDQAARWGVPAHVTVLYPFVAPADLDPAVLAALARAVATVPRFDAHFSRTGWFDDEVLWLAPEPAAAFRALTAAVMREFPHHPPYGGRHAEITPHLTVGHDAPLDDLRAAEQSVILQLPVAMPVARVHVLAGTSVPGSWRVRAEFPLG